MNNEVLENQEEFENEESTEEGSHDESDNNSEAGNEDVDSSGEESADEEVNQSAESMQKDAELETLKAEKKDLQEKYVRLLADFDNYKKNAAKQRQDLLKYQGQALVTDLLSVLDNFQYALSTSEDAGTEESFRQGITLIHKNFIDTLERWGIRCEESVGTPFDPAKHNALSMVENSEFEPGSVVQELKKAFYYKDRLLRPAEVIVSKEKE